MQRDALLDRFAVSGLAERIAPEWRAPLLHLAVVWAVLFALTGRDWVAMAHQWWDISTYNHILFVPPIIAWVVWQRWEELAKIAPQAWWLGLVALFGALALWMLGTVAGINIASQLGAVGALAASAIVVLGPRVSAGLIFPLAYMVFLVPIGDELVPVLQMITAKLVIGLIHLCGMEAHIEGVFIDTPAGLFEVAEACSGVMFLAAMVALATLVANVCFVSWKRRAVFLCAAILLPIVANGVRAWGTIVIAQWQGIEFAAGFDHIFYGWIFFAIVVAALLGCAWRWFDRSPDDPGIDADAIKASPLLGKLERFSFRQSFASLSVVALALMFGGWAFAADHVEADLPPTLAAPHVPGWHIVAGEVPNWTPLATGADRKLRLHYHDGNGHAVDVSIAVYAGQGPDRDAAAAGQGALPMGSDWRWLEPGVSGNSWSADWLYNHGIRRLAQTSYRIGEVTTGSASRFKLAAMRDRVLMRGRPAIAMILSSEEPGADAALSRFRAAMGDPALAMDRAAGLR